MNKRLLLVICLLGSMTVYSMKDGNGSKNANAIVKLISDQREQAAQDFAAELARQLATPRVQALFNAEQQLQAQQARLNFVPAPSRNARGRSHSFDDSMNS